MNNFEKLSEALKDIGCTHDIYEVNADSAEDQDILNLNQDIKFYISCGILFCFDGLGAYLGIIEADEWRGK